MVLKNLNLIYSKIVSIIVILSYLKYNAFIFGYSTTDQYNFNPYSDDFNGNHIKLYSLIFFISN